MARSRARGSEFGFIICWARSWGLSATWLQTRSISGFSSWISALWAQSVSMARASCCSVWWAIYAINKYERPFVCLSTGLLSGSEPMMKGGQCNTIRSVNRICLTGLCFSIVFSIGKSSALRTCLHNQEQFSSLTESQ